MCGECVNVGMSHLYWDIFTKKVVHSSQSLPYYSPKSHHSLYLSGRPLSPMGWPDQFVARTHVIILRALNYIILTGG